MNNCKIETITPVHVGSGVLFQKNTEFLHKDEFVGIVDEKKILEIIGHAQIGQWVNIIENGQPLFPYLQKRRSDIELEDVCSRVMAVYCENINNAQSLKEQLHNGTGKPYLPGSSIKGAIRTAIFSSLIEHLPPFNEDNLKNRKSRFDDSFLSDKLFGKDPNHDTLRFLQVGDAMFDEGSTIAMNVMSMNHTHKSTQLNKRVSQLTEAIGTELSTQFRLTIDKTKLLKNIKYKTIETDIRFLENFEALFQLLNHHTIKLLESEIEFWKRYDGFEVVSEYLENITEIKEIASGCGESETVLRLGHGSGWTFMTGNWPKSEALISDEIWNQIVDKARPGNQRKYSDYFFPKTRRMDEEGFLLGFVKISGINK
jgi:CRISPR type III-A-associated RAMP protein Csm5